MYPRIAVRGSPLRSGRDRAPPERGRTARPAAPRHRGAYSPYGNAQVRTVGRTRPAEPGRDGPPCRGGRRRAAGVVRTSRAYEGPYASMVEGYRVGPDYIEAHRVFVAADDTTDRVLGFYALVLDPPELDLMFVADEAQGRGIGRLLAAHLREEARAAGLAGVRIVPTRPPRASTGASAPNPSARSGPIRPRCGGPARTPAPGRLNPHGAGPAACGDRAPPYRRSPEGRSAAVRTGDQFQPVAAGIGEVHSLAAVVAVDLAGQRALRIGVELDSQRLDPRERGVELRLRDQERVVLRRDRRGGDGREVQSDVVRGRPGRTGPIPPRPSDPAGPRRRRRTRGCPGNGRWCDSTRPTRWNASKGISRATSTPGR
ncbi:hypothetical protein SCALM49S_05534 [Streptomyces californicus]